MDRDEYLPPAELLHLVSELLDGQLGEDDRLRLRDLLRDNVAAQDEYRRIMLTHARLMQLDPSLELGRAAAPFFNLSPAVEQSSMQRSLELNGECVEETLDPPSVESRSRSQKKRRFPLWRAAAVTAALAGCIVFAVFWTQSPPSQNDAGDNDSIQQHGIGKTFALGAKTKKPPFCLVVFRKDSGTIRSSGKTRTPDQSESGLSDTEMAEVLAYVTAHKLPSKSFEGNKPVHVRQNEDSTVQLPAAAAEVYGSTLVFEKEYGNLGYWESSNDWAVWEFTTNAAGSFDVVMDYACHDVTSNNRFVMVVDGKELSGTVKGTGTWDDYRQTVVGRVQLPAGEHRLIFRSASEPRQPRDFLIDLRTIILQPKPEDPKNSI